jgi:hypothetical protein
LQAHPPDELAQAGFHHADQLACPCDRQMVLVDDLDKVLNIRRLTRDRTINISEKM